MTFWLFLERKWKIFIIFSTPQKCAKVSNQAAIEASLEAHKKRVQAQIQKLKEKADREREERKSDVEKQKLSADEVPMPEKPKSEKRGRTRGETGRIVDSKTEDLNREMKINFEKERRGKLKRVLEQSQQKPVRKPNALYFRRFLKLKFNSMSSTTFTYLSTTFNRKYEFIMSCWL